MTVITGLREQTQIRQLQVPDHLGHAIDGRGIGLPLAARAGSLGASLAALAASALYAWHITTRARRELKYSLADAGRAMALSVVFVPLALVRGAWWLNAALLASGLAAYGVLLVAFRVVTASELGTLRRLLGVQAAPKE